MQDEDGVTLWTNTFKSVPSDVWVVQMSNHQEIISFSVRMKPVSYFIPYRSAVTVSESQTAGGTDP